MQFKLMFNIVVLVIALQHLVHGLGEGPVVLLHRYVEHPGVPK